MPMIFVKKEVEVLIEFPRVVYPKLQPKWDGKDYDKLESIRVENAQEYKALKIDFVLNFKEVTNKVTRKPAKKQTKLEV